MSVRHKIARKFILGFEGVKLTSENPIIDEIQNQHLGGVILFDKNFQKNNFNKNIKDPKQLKSLCEQLQSLSPNHLIISIDQEGGRVARLKSERGFMKTISAKDISQLSDVEVELYANKMAAELKELGINLNFAPCLDLDYPNNPIIHELERSFATNPELVSKYATIFKNAFLSNNITPAFKHFPGHGSSLGDPHLEFVNISNTWRIEELIPYKNLCNEKTENVMVMTSHLVNTQLDPTELPATLSKTILTELLRNELGFQGLIVSDDLQMQAIQNSFSLKDSLIKCINAGVDILIFGNQLNPKRQNLKELIDMVETAIIDGQIKETTIEESHQRIKNHI